MDYQAVLAEVESWPVYDRIRFVQDVLGRLTTQGVDTELSSETKAELDRRIESLDRNPEANVTWEEVRSRALYRLRK